MYAVNNIETLNLDTKEEEGEQREAVAITNVKTVTSYSWLNSEDPDLDEEPKIAVAGMLIQPKLSEQRLTTLQGYQQDGSIERTAHL